MARPRSTDRRDAILTAATHVIAADGPGAPTAAIAQAAGVSNGSLFLYFETKPVLMNALFVELKTEMARVAQDGVPREGGPRDQVQHIWTQWLAWATADPDKRRTLAQLAVSEDITAASHQVVSAAFINVAALLERSRAGGPMQDAPLTFVLSLINAIAEAAIDEILRNPADAEAASTLAFEAIWRVLAG